MTDDRLRGYRRFPDKPMYQVVVYLHQPQCEKVYQNVFELAQMRHAPAAVLQTAAQAVAAIDDRQQRRDGAASTAALAGVGLNHGYGG